MDHIDDGFDVVHRRVLENAVTQVEDVPRSASGPPQNIMHPLFQYGRVCK